MGFVDCVSSLGDQNQSSIKCGDPDATLALSVMQEQLGRLFRARGSEATRELWDSWQSKNEPTGLIKLFFFPSLSACDEKP